MLSLRNRFGIPGVISVLALVFALVGGAYAAENSGDGATASAKKNNRAKKKKGKNKGVTIAQVRRIARQEARKFANSNPGPVGPVGLPGATGAQGPKGDKGDAGSNGSDGKDGTNGTNGTSATGTAYTGAECAEASGEGGVKVTTAGGDNYVCNGKDGEDGETGFTDVLPPGETETGVWGFSITGEGPRSAVIPVSLNIPLAAKLPNPNVIFLKKAEDACNAKSEPEKAECLAGLDENCPGTVANPDAKEGFFCMYQQSISPLPFVINVSNLSTAGVVVTMAYLSGAGGEGHGSFAVTAPPSP